jgi:hypothetical protein
MNAPSVFAGRLTVEYFTLIGEPPRYAVLHLMMEACRHKRVGVYLNNATVQENILLLRWGRNRFSGAALFGALDLQTRRGWIAYD